MKRKSTKLEILKEVIAHTRRAGHGPSPLMTADDYARDHVRVLCEALQLRLTRLYRDPQGFGYEIRITRAGLLVAAGEFEEAASHLDSGTGITRLPGEPPQGVLATLLQANGAGLVLDGLAARQYAPEMMRCVATGHLVVLDGVIRAVAKGDPMRNGATILPPSARAWAQERASALPSSRAARHITVPGR